MYQVCELLLIFFSSRFDIKLIWSFCFLSLSHLFIAIEALLFFLVFCNLISPNTLQRIRSFGKNTCFMIDNTNVKELIFFEPFFFSVVHLWTAAFCRRFITNIFKSKCSWNIVNKIYSFRIKAGLSVEESRKKYWSNENLMKRKKHRNNNKINKLSDLCNDRFNRLRSIIKWHFFFSQS